MKYWVESMSCRKYRQQTILVVAISLLVVVFAAGQEEKRPFCDDEGVWFQTLGSGDLDVDNDRAAGAYLIWLDGKARILVDAGSGTTLRYDESHAVFDDLQAILLTQNTVEHTGDLLSLLVGSKRLERQSALLIFGPEGVGEFLSTTELFNRLTGPEGAYPQWHRLGSHDSPLGYRVTVRDVPSIGRKSWSGYGTPMFQLQSIPVNFGEVPAVAWRIEIGGHTLVFAGDFNNQKDAVATFAEGADLLVFSHHIPEGTVGTLREQYVTPNQIGRIAFNAGVRFIALGNRSWRTFAREERSMEVIERQFEGVQIFTNELECWGL